MFIASAQIEANQLDVAVGTTVFERTRGIRPISTQDLMSIRAMPDSYYVAAVKAMKWHGRHMIDLLRDRCSALMAKRLVQQEKRAEYNFASALDAEAAKNVHDMAAHEGMGLHDTVSYKGDCYVMECAEPDSDWPPSRAFLHSPCHGLRSHSQIAVAHELSHRRYGFIPDSRLFSLDTLLDSALRLL